MTISIISRWMARLGITGLYVGRSVPQCPPGSLVVFPYDPQTVSCGITALVAFKRTAPSDWNLQTLHRTLDDIAACTWDKLKAQELDPIAHYLGGPELLGRMRALGARLKEQAPFYEVYADRACQQQLSALAQRLAELVHAEERMRREQSGREAPPIEDVMAARLTSLRDILWSLEHDVLQTIDQVTQLGRLDQEACPRAGVGRLQELNLILNNLDRLEVRGRDSAGLSLLVVVQESHYTRFMKTLAHASLREEFAARTTGAVLEHRNITVNRTSAGVSMALTYKVAAEVGSLGDNGVYLRGQLRDDAIFQHVVRLPLRHHTVVAHTRWASVGEISVPNCHPVDGDRSETSAIIHVCLNGDIDNYQALKQEYEQETGRAVPEAISTDTKIIPLRMQKYLQRGQSVEDAFRLAVNDFEGAHAIAMHTDLAPGRVFLAQRGSGQALFIGLAPDHYVVGSEVYGFVEAASRYLKLDGAKMVPGHSGPTQGQIVVLQQASEGDLAGVQAMAYDGTPIVLSPNDVKETELTSRDIDRQSYPHYFLKEIYEAPRSVEQTMQGRLAVVAQAGRLHPRIELDETVIPPRLAQAFRDQRIRHLFFIGQGTAGVAGDVCAALVRTYLHPTPIQVASCKASEFSGFRLHDQGEETLVVAITQSGTTTDTNRAIDMARNQQAHTLAIVNRRESDITFKVDGVLYTSSGRDIEMSVASTKAYYAQIVAGSILGLKLAELTGARSEDDILAEIAQLRRLPGLMQQVLARHAEIEASARRLAVTKRYWAVVGSGPNKASADEIRIKLSELCYKTISSDIVEDKKHIDLSAEPLIVVCAAGNRDDVLSDMVKDTAIFKAHRAVPIVIATEGEHRFDPYAEAVLHVPAVHAGLSPILNTLAGHLWGYYAALSIHEESRHLFAFREAIRHHVAAAVGQGRDLYEIVLDDPFREQVAAFERVFKDKLRQDRYATALSIQTASDLTLLLKYMAGRLPSSDFEGDFGVKGTPPNILDTFFACMGQIIGELTRPVDAIKHQAKTVTVGTSRLADKATGLLFDALGQHGFETGQLSTSNVVVLRRLQEVVGAIHGTTLYRISGLNLLGEPVDTSTIALEQKAGSSARLPSRVESDTRLRGTKRIIVQNGNVFIGKGRRDQRSILVIPIMSTATTIDYLLLLHVGFRPAVALDQKVAALGGKYHHIRHLVEETRFAWHDAYLNRLEMEELFGWSAEKVSERILAVLRTASTAAIVPNPS